MRAPTRCGLLLALAGCAPAVRPAVEPVPGAREGAGFDETVLDRSVDPCEDFYAFGEIAERCVVW